MVVPREFPDPFLEALLLALPFRIEHPQKVLVIEGKSGQEVYLAHHFQSEEIELVTSSFLFRSFLQDFIPHFPGKVLVASPRRYVGKRQNSYDLITVRVPVGRASVFAGSFSFQEDFIFTCEGIIMFFSALKERGMLLLPIFLQNPPSLLPKLVRLLATVMGSENCLQSLMVLKNFEYALLVVKKGGGKKMIYSSGEKKPKGGILILSTSQEERRKTSNRFFVLEDVTFVPFKRLFNKTPLITFLICALPGIIVHTLAIFSVLFSFEKLGII
ncbi:MAG: hypothetical protein ACUVRN_10095 [Candidatus Caldatribacteriaceae bacterium]